MTDLIVRKKLGREHLQNNRVDQALELFAEILQDYPEDVESYMIMGDFYLAGDDYRTAEQLYECALGIEPENPEIQRRITLARAEQPRLPGESLPTHPEAISRLLQRLTGRTRPIPEKEIERAASLLNTIIHSPDPAEKVATYLDQIDNLLPALLELNIRQAKADGRPDLVKMLQALQTNIKLQMSSQDEDGEEHAADEAADVAVSAVPARFSGRVLLLAAEGQCSSGRMATLAEGLQMAGCQVETALSISANNLARPDVVIASNPHTRPELMESLAACSAMGVPIILDLDTDFEQMPVNHPDYAAKALTTPVRARAFTAAQLLAKLVTAPSEQLVAALHNSGYRAELVPDAWSPHNPLWRKPSPERKTINLGWVGYAGQMDDLAQIRRVIIRVMREFPQCQLVIAGDIHAYQLFESLPEYRRMYLPPVGYEDYPYLLGQIDILLHPMRNCPYNVSAPDTLMMEVGAKRIPWIASPMPGPLSWKAGGLSADSTEEWHTYLRQLILDTDLRTSLAEAGFHQATGRTVEKMTPLWIDVIEKALRDPAAESESGIQPAQDAAL
ncbi:MAG: tetratricopeptide repeat protein [Chloroflexi bacterium]|nr:tetratricopeptide repeat protein [Anaerolineaceae bacterium]NMB90540.1 tetratricopeptide repeat protein [Chloroflexota bacterium]